MRDVNHGGIEGSADPCQRFGMLFVVRIGDRFEELAVAPGATDVLGRTAADCSVRRGYVIPGCASAIHSMRTVCSQPSPKS